MKKITLLLVLVMVCTMVFVGCGKEEKKDEPVDYSQYSFTDVRWTRDAEQDIETIRFGSDGSHAYYCSCGNSVNDSDLCEGYRYDDETKTITLICLEETDEMVTEIKVVKYDENELQLDFDGEIRIFLKDE